MFSRRSIWWCTNHTTGVTLHSEHGCSELYHQKKKNKTKPQHISLSVSSSLVSNLELTPVWLDVVFACVVFCFLVCPVQYSMKIGKKNVYHGGASLAKFNLLSFRDHANAIFSEPIMALRVVVFFPFRFLQQHWLLASKEYLDSVSLFEGESEITSNRSGCQ